MILRFAPRVEVVASVVCILVCSIDYIDIASVVHALYIVQFPKPMSSMREMKFASVSLAVNHVSQGIVRLGTIAMVGT
jgi:hypothetical protein